MESSLLRPRREDSPCRGFHGSLSSLRGQPARTEEAQESCWESCLRGKNCVGRASVSAECVPSSYNSGSYVPDVPERRWNFRRKQNVMAAGSTSCSRKFRRVTTAATPLVPSAIISSCVRENVVEIVGNKYRLYHSIWEILGGLTFKSNSRRKYTKSDVTRLTRYISCNQFIVQASYDYFDRNFHIFDVIFVILIRRIFGHVRYLSAFLISPE